MFSLKSYNTFGVEAYTNELIHIRSLDDLTSLNSSSPLKILGGGSNVLLTKNADHPVVRMEIQGIDIFQDSENEVLVRVGGGVIWNDLVNWALEHNLAGIENLSLIPGTVGAAPIQNIGAYGVELKDVFISLMAWNLDKTQLEVFDREQCRFAYRNSIFKQELKNKFIICSVDLKLQKQATINRSYGAINQRLELKNILHPGIKEISEAVIEIRNEKLPDPKLIGNAGSFFKNVLVEEDRFKKLHEKFAAMPYFIQDDGMVKIPSGWLIESCGWKGRQLGNVACYKNQALVIINCGQATGKEILNFAELITHSVFEKFGLQLEPEVNIW